MTKAKRITINEKPLSRKDTIKLAQSEGILNERYSDILTEKYDGKIITLRQAYTLPGERVLYIRDVDGKYDGKGDIFTKEYFEKFVNHLERMQQDIENGRNSNIAHWHFYSSNKSNLIEKIPSLLTELYDRLECDGKMLDLTTASLDDLSEKINKFERQVVLTTLYDNLVAYIGEVIKKNSKNASIWILDKNFEYPSISTSYKGISFNPINVVWEELTSMDDANFRKAYGKELRQVGNRLGSEKFFNGIN